MKYRLEYEMRRCLTSCVFTRTYAVSERIFEWKVREMRAFNHG